MNIIDMLDEEGPHMRALAVSDVLANMEEGDEQIFYEFISGEALEKVGKLVDRFRRECFPQEFTKANWEAA